MRIRKRQLLFPLPSASPVPISDPHLINPSPVVQLDDIALPPKPSTPPSLLDHSRPPDQPLPQIGKPADASDDSSGIAALATDCGVHRQPKKQYGSEEDGRERGEEGEKSHDTRKGSSSGSQTVADHVLSPSSPSNQDGRWCEGEKAIPLKKRRGSFERIKVEEYEVTQNNNKKEKTRMKTKMNKKCSRQNDNEDDHDESVVVEEGGERETKRERNAGRKRGRGSAVMEGSRCSRVNGRGWRCCQQTLVGYSLCEHHLGKGRLRSITSVKNRSVAATAPVPEKPEPYDLLSQVSTSSSLDVNQTNDGGEQEEEKKPVIIAKKKMKLGVVKARSISSLLGQTDTHVAVLENNK